MKTTGDQQLVKRINRSILLRLVRAQPGLSRAQLAHESGLTKSTVSLLIRELIDEGWLSESSTTSKSGLGRPSTPLQMDAHVRGLIGVEVAVDCIRVVGVNLMGHVVCSVEEALHSTLPSKVCHQLAQLVVQVHAELVVCGYTPSGVGVGLPGAFDESTGVVWFAPNLGWRRVDILSQILGALSAVGLPNLPLHVQNDADTGALSEYEFQVDENRSALIFVACGVGVGAGIVLNDRLFIGAQGMAGEIGHSILQINGPKCTCGRHGCAETFVGAKALALNGDRFGNVELAGKYLGVLIHNLWTTFNPSVLILGGPSCVESPQLVGAAQEVLQAHAANARMTAPVVRVARYGLLACAVGAAALVLHHYLRPMNLRNHPQLDQATIGQFNAPQPH
jgi:predicted NBD/HSP70 family sugar kinase